MSKWVIDHKDTYIAVREENNLTNRAFCEKSKLVYGEFREVIGTKLDEHDIEQAYKICDMLNELEEYRKTGLNPYEIDYFKNCGLNPCDIESMKKLNMKLIIERDSYKELVESMGQTNSVLVKKLIVGWSRKGLGD